MEAELVGRGDIIKKLKKEAAEDPEAKYLDLALEYYEQGLQIKQQIKQLHFLNDRLEMQEKVIENFEKAVELLIKAIMVGEDTALALRKLKKAIARRAHVRTKVLALLMAHGRLKFSEIRDIVGTDDHTLTDALQDLFVMGYIEKEEDKYYKLKKSVADGILNIIWTAADEFYKQEKKKGLK